MLIPRIHINFPKNLKKLFLMSIVNKRLVSGPSINRFENQFSNYIGTKYAISISSARIGLYLILKALLVKKNDEVILSSYNTQIVPNILKSIGVKPIFIDIDLKTLNINPNQIEKKITKKTKAVIVLHTEGQPCELNKIKEIAKKYNLCIIEDCAHAIGSTYKNRKVGSIGDVGFFSFGIGKFINTIGGGMIVTNKKEIFKKIKKLLKLFNKPKEFILIKKFCYARFISFLMNPIIFFIFIYPFLTFFSIFNTDIIIRFFEDRGTPKIKNKNLIKFSNFQALLGLNQLKEIEDKLKKQRDNVNFLIKNIDQKKIKFQMSIPESSPCYLHFTVLDEYRNRIIKRLLRKGIDCQTSWMISCSPKGQCPISDRMSNQAFYIPLYYTLTKNQVKYIAYALNSVG